jgi:UDP-N-acetylmuramoyl-tripeptide--D-alanyl-D-alanine ligase
VRPRTLSEVAAAVGGRLDGGDATVTSVVTDSRIAVSGSLFFALRGERLDGHRFVAEALERGAVAAVVDGEGIGAPAVRVRDTGRALLELAADERRGMNATVLGITGANGKTSTKDLAAAVLATRLRTYASPRSFNNEVGLPVTLLSSPPDTEALICEMGARRPGDVTLLSRIARPDVVVVTNVGVAHMEIFGSWENIVASAAEPVDALMSDGVAVLNADDAVVRALGDRASGRVILFGSAQDAGVRAEDVVLDDEGRASFTLAVEADREPVTLTVPGEHMVSNALAAVACGIVVGVPPSESAVALKGARVSEWRMETFVTPGGIRVVNDAYNANPESMAAGLRAARWMSRTGRMAAVLGHMAELGPIAFDEHEKVGSLIVRLGVDRLITVGELARPIARAAVREGALPEDVASYDDTEEVLADLRRWARRGDVVLLKGSRVAGLERLAEALR